jgi:hypothetical protein
VKAVSVIKRAKKVLRIERDAIGRLDGRFERAEDLRTLKCCTSLLNRGR